MQPLSLTQLLSSATHNWFQHNGIQYKYCSQDVSGSTRDKLAHFCWDAYFGNKIAGKYNLPIFIFGGNRREQLIERIEQIKQNYPLVKWINEEEFICE